MAKRGKKNEDNNNENKDPQNRTQIIVAIIGVAGVVTAAFIGVLPTILQFTNSTPTSTTDALTDTPIPPTTVPPLLIFSDYFDNNNNQWYIDQAPGAFDLSSHYKTFVHIENGKYYREIESNESYTDRYGARPIPNISRKNFCLIFDSRINDTPQDAAIIIAARAVEWESFYYIRFNIDGGGVVKNVFDQIGAWSNGISWSDGQTHTVMISFQDNDLKVYDGQKSTLIFSLNLDNNNMLSTSGEIRLGSELFHPNQRATFEFDNVFVYDKCP